MTTRKCAGCGQYKNSDEMIKLTHLHESHEVVINRDTKKFGRSAYLCYNNSCIENAFKKSRIHKALKCPVPRELKGLLLNELRNSKN